MVDSKARVLDVNVAGQDYSLTQNLGILQSTRAGGTTGGAVWRSSVAMSGWLASPHSLLTMLTQLSDRLAGSAVVELGCGISPLLALTVHDRAARYIATDQEYILAHFKRNIADNMQTEKLNTMQRRNQVRRPLTAPRIETLALDWETHHVSKQLGRHLRDFPHQGEQETHADIAVLLACDCIFNEHLIEPFVQACRAICELQRQLGSGRGDTLCVTGHQVRCPEVLEQWMSSMMQHFTLSRVKSRYLCDDFAEPSGFVAHLAVLR